MGMDGSGGFPIDESWFERSFGAFYPLLYAHRSVDAAAPEAAFAANAVSLGSEDVALDLCCGTGRHMVHLQPRARRIVGLDFSPELLSRAHAVTGAHAVLVRADMRAIPFQDAFDVIFNFFTSFGYFLTDADNRAVVYGIAAALRRGGRLFMDHMNGVYAVANLVPETERVEQEYLVHESRWVEGNRINKSVKVYKGGVRIREFSESVRMYTLDELAVMLGESGLRVETVYGDYTGVAMDASQPRMIVIARKG